MTACAQGWPGPCKPPPDSGEREVFVSNHIQRFGQAAVPVLRHMRKWLLFESQNTRKHAMEAERTNTIRNSLADLTARVAELRRYL